MQTLAMAPDRRSRDLSGFGLRFLLAAEDWLCGHQIFAITA